MAHKLKPLHDRVVVERSEAEEKPPLTTFNWNSTMTPIESDEELQKLIPQTMLNIDVLRSTSKED